MTYIIKEARTYTLRELFALRGDIVDNCVYIVRDAEQRPLYVGKSFRGLKKRLREHERRESAFGYELAYAADREAWTIEVLIIRHGLDKAEREYIKTLAPRWNTVGNPNRYEV